ncbi:hypothetical protein [Treponema sp. OMZ 838]|nr:hypothetical protein [Treponema sp. OMZ 838]
MYKIPLPPLTLFGTAAVRGGADGLLYPTYLVQLVRFGKNNNVNRW